MKFLFAISHLYFWSPLEDIALQLCGQGDKVRLLLDKRRHGKWTDRYLFDSKTKPYSFGWMKPRIDIFDLLLTTTREYLNYAAYLRVRQPTSILLTERARNSIPKLSRFFTRFGSVKKWLQSDQGWQAIHHIENVTPPSWIILRELRSYDPDVLVAGSAVLDYSKEIDYLKAANHLDMPTVVVIPSWDNLTTKGTLHVIPDWLFVWNHGQVDEATKLHNVPEERIFCTGAPKYDPWFNFKPIVNRKEFCEGIGIEPSRPYLLYICSSEFIAGDETVFVDELSARLGQHPKLKNLVILVRPHPQNLRYWESYRAKNDNIVLWPKDLLILEPSVMIQDFYHSIYFSMGVIGINTSAFIETAIVDRPCIAIAADRYKYTQIGIPHFHHLLDADFLELPHDLDETANTVARIMNGDDSKVEKRSKFVRDFLRPHGLEKSATEIMHNAIKNVASGRNPGDFSTM